MAALSEVLSHDEDVVFESAEEQGELQFLTEIFGKDRSSEIRKTFAQLRHVEPKANRFIEITNALLATVEEEEQILATKSVANSAKSEENGVPAEMTPNENTVLTTNQDVQPLLDSEKQVELGGKNEFASLKVVFLFLPFSVNDNLILHFLFCPRTGSYSFTFFTAGFHPPPPF